MGYSHYWRMDKPLKVTKEQRNLIGEVLKENHALLAGWGGDKGTKPVFTAKELSFNGIEDEAHETFRVEFEKQEGFSFCKTARKPYDLAVCKILLVLAQSEGFNISSDGCERDEKGVKTLADENWSEAVAWAMAQGLNMDKVNLYINSER